ncbi:MAG: peptidyl-prolyl cis-trans isomerase [Phycisphaeraceae bacterium]|nr:peptidyl-prolyl cis-trans isomerase [Phycisphaeraceae bacterium]
MGSKLVGMMRAKHLRECGWSLLGLAAIVAGCSSSAKKVDPAVWTKGGSAIALPAEPEPRAAAGAGHASATTQPSVSLTGPAVSTEAVVGQVNGRAIYAAKVLDPIDGQLKVLAQSLRPTAFAGRARELIAARLNQITLDALIVGEAERELNEGERERLRTIMKDVRAELVRKHGTGSEALADRVLRETTGQSLDEKLREEREKILIQNYTSRHLLPKVNVTRQDVEKYYQANIDKYQPREGRKVRMIVVDQEPVAAQVDQMLAEGKSFLEIAGDASVNQYRANQQGLLGENLTGEKILDDAEVNAAVLALAAGEHTPRMRMRDRLVWVMVESIQQAEAKSLPQVQEQIQRHLRAEQLRVLTMQFRDRLLASGSFTSLADMTEAALEVATSRYLGVK